MAMEGRSVQELVQFTCSAVWEIVTAKKQFIPK